MKFRIGAALVGLGVLLLVVAVGLPLYVAPALTKLPYDLERSTTVAEAPNATFMQIKKVGEDTTIEIRRGSLESTIEVLPRAQMTNKLPADLKDETVAWEVYQTVKWKETNELINGYATALALDRVSGAAVDWDGQWLDESAANVRPDDGKAAPDAVKVDYAGQTYKFPFGTEKKDYEYFDRDLRKALPAKFAGTETIRGLETYRFEQVITNEPQNIDPGRISLLLARFAPRATSGKVVYSNTRTLWVEPVTGQYLRVREQQHKELVPNTGSPTVLLDATFTYTDATTKAAAERSGDNASKLMMLRRYAPIGLGVLGVIALVAGLLLIARGNGAGAGARRRTGGADDTAVDQASYPAGTVTDTLPPASQNWRKDSVPSQRKPSADRESR